MRPASTVLIMQLSNSRAGPTAPAKGLTLVGMEYEDF